MLIDTILYNIYSSYMPYIIWWLQRMWDDFLNNQEASRRFVQCDNNVSSCSSSQLMRRRCLVSSITLYLHISRTKHDQYKPKNPSYLFIYLYGDIWEGFLFLTALRWVPKEKGRLVTHGSFTSHLFMQKHIFWLHTHW